MQYEKTGKKVNQQTAKNAQVYSLGSIDTKTILKTLARRHKFALSVALNIVFAIYFFLPFLPGEIVSLVTTI